MLMYCGKVTIYFLYIFPFRLLRNFKKVAYGFLQILILVQIQDTIVFKEIRVLFVSNVDTYYDVSGVKTIIPDID